jgi:HK97 family phage major capsid protein
MSDQLKGVVDGLNALQDDMRATLDKQSEEIKAHGESTAETGRKVAELDKLLNEARAELADRIEQAENAIARGSRGGGEAPESPGAAFASSEQLKTMLQNRQNNSQPVEVGSFFSPQAATLTEYPSQPGREPGIIAPPARPRVRDLFRVTQTDRVAIQYVERTGYTNNAETVQPGGLKPESALEFALRTASMRKIAHWLPVVDEVLSDENDLRDHVDGELIEGLKEKEDEKLLYGPGDAASDIQGIMTHANAQAYYGGSEGETGDTMIDAVRRAMVKAEDARYAADGVVLNHRDWAKIETLKGNDGHYLWVNITVGGQRQLWRVPVVATPAMNEGEFLTGAFDRAARLYDRMQAMIKVADQHADYAIHNTVAIIAEERLALAVFRPEAFVVGSYEGTTPA